MTGLNDAQTLLGAASAAPDRELRTLYLARARLILAESLEQLVGLQRHLEALEGELARTAPPKERT